MLDRLLPRLPADKTQVVVDNPSQGLSPWRGYRRCLEDAPDDCTHLIILQDDAWTCDAFLPLLNQAIDDHPDSMISLFVGALPNETRVRFRRALMAGERWCEIVPRDIHHVVALVWPKPLIGEFLAWVDEHPVPGPQPPLSDDAAVGYWARQTSRQFFATVPCLVEHLDDLPSTIGRKSGDKGRRAIAFMDELG